MALEEHYKGGGSPILPLGKRPWWDGECSRAAARPVGGPRAAERAAPRSCSVTGPTEAVGATR